MAKTVTKLKVPKERQRELQRDIEVLRKIVYETIEKTVILKQKVNMQKPTNNQEKSMLKAIEKHVDASNFVFFDPSQIVNNCFVQNQDEDVLNKIRKTRAMLTKLVINVDKIIFELSYGKCTTPQKQFRIFLHLFDGLTKNFRKERNEIQNLIKTFRGYKGEQPVEPIIVSLSKARLIVMFFIKWLTIADNQFTDNDVGNATDEEKSKFVNDLNQKLGSLSNSEQYALGTYLFNKLNSIERKLDNHSQESRVTLRLIHDDVIAIKDTCIQLATQKHEEAKKFVESQSKQIESLLSEVEKTLHSIDRGNSAKAKNWKEQLVKGIGISADIIALISFISGIPSIPALVYSPQANQAITILKQFSEKLKV